MEFPNAAASSKLNQDGGADEMPIDSMFNADEIDDPFSTKQDKEIENKDICERL